MDVQMPEMNGYEATAVIRDPSSSVLDHRVPIIAMTANAMRGDRERRHEAGMDDYLARPVQIDALAAILARRGARGRVVVAIVPESVPAPEPVIFS